MYVGGAEQGVHGRQTETKAIVTAAVEVVNEKRLGRVRLQRVAAVSARRCGPSCKQAVEPGSSVLTDAWGATPVCPGSVAIIWSSTSPPRRTPPTWSCLRCAASPPSSHAGSAAHTRVRSAASISTTTSTSLRSASIAGALARGGCCPRLLEQAVQTQHTPTEALFLAIGIGPR